MNIDINHPRNILKNRALSIKDLNSLGKAKMDPSFSVKLNIRSGEQLYKQGIIYMEEKDFTKAYIYFMKFSQLIIRELPKHPEYKSVENQAILKLSKKNCLFAIEQLEKLKPILEKRYNDYIELLEKWKMDNKGNGDITKGHKKNESKVSFEKKSKQEIVSKYDPNWSVADALPDFSNKAKDKDISFKPVTKDYSNPYMSISQLLEIQKKAQQESKATLMNEKIPLAVKNGRTHDPVSAIYNILPPPPLIPPKANDIINNTEESEYVSYNTISTPPPIPPKGIDIYTDLSENGAEDKPLSVAEKVGLIVPPVTNAFTEGGLPLRTVSLPSGLIAEFSSISQTNTKANIETCGILAGKLEKDIFYLTCLVIPKQQGTSDSCSMTHEEELFDYLDTRDLITLGWIHTHPTQTCFLSSVDLHTHASFQIMLPEAVAIVVAPKHKPSSGAFRLTDPPGLPAIAKCRDPAPFHPHELSQDELYLSALFPNGHACFVEHAPFEVVDLRT